MPLKINRMAKIWAGTVVIAGALAGCATDTAQDAFNTEFSGGAVGDEPQAVLVARDVLSAGGSAVDAAVAMYATLSVTYPVAAGVGGGGLCLIYDPKSEKVESLNFLPRSPIAGGPYAVPGTMRGLAAMHGRYGRLAWGQIIGLAERLARFEAVTSRALVKRLQAMPDGVGPDPLVQNLFVNDASGIAEGKGLQQLDLATTLGTIRARGGGDFYQGQSARKFVEAANAAGGRLTLEDMRRYSVLWQEPMIFDTPTGLTKLGGQSFVLPPADTVAARRAAWMWRLLGHGGFTHDLGSPKRAEVMAHAGARAVLVGDDPVTASVSQVWSSGVPNVSNIAITDQGGATAFAVGDNAGQAVSCVSTMNGTLGSKRVAAGTGVILAPNVDANALDMAFATPALVVNFNTQQVIMAAGGSGGTPDAIELPRVIADVLVGDHLLEDALAAPRVFSSGRPQAVFTESSLSAPEQSNLKSFGQQIPVATFGRLNLINCSGGMRTEPETCVLHKDPRGFGLSTADLF